MELINKIKNRISEIRYFSKTTYFVEVKELEIKRTLMLDEMDILEEVLEELKKHSHNAEEKSK